MSLVESVKSDWRRHFGTTPPITYVLKLQLADHWVRIHSLPHSQRYASNELEYNEILNRHRAIVNYFVCEGEPLHILSNFLDDKGILARQFAWEPYGHIPDPEVEDDPVIFECKVTKIIWEKNQLDTAFKAAADDEARIILITNRALIAPYDGGIDIIFVNMEEKQWFRRLFKDWLPTTISGL